MEDGDKKKDRHAEICEMVAEGMTIRQIAAHFGCSPGTVISWATDTKEHSEQYARAREAAADMFEMEIIDAAMSVTPDSAQADRVKIDAMKWVAARRAPKKYGDRQAVEHTSPDGSMTPKPAIDAAKLSDAALREIAAARIDADK
jgi:transcriptional regulator with XRE-family HTH domain